MNKAMLIGRLGKDPEIRHLENGNMVAQFSVATSEKYKDKTTGEKKETTEWHNIVIWGKLAEVAGKYLHKGDQIFLEGKIYTRSWEKDGIKRYTTEIVVFEMTMLGGKKEAQQGTTGAPIPQEQQGRQQTRTARTAQATQPQQAQNVNDGPEDDLPF